MKYKRLLFLLQASTPYTKEKEYFLLPTPNAQDWNTGTKPQTYLNRKKKHLDKKVNLQMSIRQIAANLTPPNTPTYKVNISYVEGLMGFPERWTELPFLNGEKSQSKRTETQ